MKVFSPKKSKVVVFLISLLLLAVSSAGATNLQPDERFGEIKAYADRPLELTEEQISQLPEQARIYIEETKDPLIASAATVHVVQKTASGELVDVAKKNYDFGKPGVIEQFNADMKLYEDNPTLGLKVFGVDGDAPTLQGSNDHGVIITGLNVTRITPSSFRNHFQVHGWWEWKTQGFSSNHDRLGNLWTSDFNSAENTHQAWRHPVGGGSQTTLSKLPYNNIRFANKGVMWRHGTTMQTVGATRNQITSNVVYQGDHWVGTQFEYVRTNVSTVDDGWSANIASLFFNYYNLIVKNHYSTFVWIYAN